MIQMILNRYFEKVISAWGPHDLPWSLLVYNNVRICKKKRRALEVTVEMVSVGTDDEQLSTLLDTASFGCLSIPIILTNPDIIDVRGYEASNANLNHPSSFQG